MLPKSLLMYGLSLRIIDVIVFRERGGSGENLGFTWALANDVATKSQLLALPHAMGPDSGDTQPPRIPIIAIPTTLSGGEYIPFAGVTDGEDKTKYQFTGHCKRPALIILSGELATHTPLHTWLTSGVRSIDHCVEALCTLRQPEKRWEGSGGGFDQGLAVPDSEFAENQGRPCQRGEPTCRPACYPMLACPIEGPHF